MQLFWGEMWSFIIFCHANNVLFLDISGSLGTVKSSINTWEKVCLFLWLKLWRSSILYFLESFSFSFWPISHWLSFYISHSSWSRGVESEEEFTLWCPTEPAHLHSSSTHISFFFFFFFFFLSQHHNPTNMLFKKPKPLLPPTQQK